MTVATGATKLAAEAAGGKNEKLNNAANVRFT